MVAGFCDSAGHAQREIGLAAGERPVKKDTRLGFCAAAQNLRTRRTLQEGSITGFFTVLVEGDDFNEPICDAVRAFWTVTLSSRGELGAAGHYPALDIRHSLSRLTSRVGLSAAGFFHSKNSGGAGSLSRFARSHPVGRLCGRKQSETGCVHPMPAGNPEFLKQDAHAFSSLSETLERLEKLVAHLG